MYSTVVSSFAVTFTIVNAVVNLFIGTSNKATDQLSIITEKLSVGDDKSMIESYKDQLNMVTVHMDLTQIMSVIML